MGTQYCHTINTPSDRGVIESVPPPIGGGVIESGPIPYHLLATPLVIINERPLSSPKSRISTLYTKFRPYVICLTLVQELKLLFSLAVCILEITWYFDTTVSILLTLHLVMHQNNFRCTLRNKSLNEYGWFPSNKLHWQPTTRSMDSFISIFHMQSHK